jgi:hypothetical protein
MRIFGIIRTAGRDLWGILGLLEGFVGNISTAGGIFRTAGGDLWGLLGLLEGFVGNIRTAGGICGDF